MKAYVEALGVLFEESFLVHARKFAEASMVKGDPHLAGALGDAIAHLTKMHQALQETAKHWIGSRMSSRTVIRETRWIVFQAEIVAAWFVERMLDRRAQLWPEATPPVVTSAHVPQGVGMPYLRRALQSVMNMLSPSTESYGLRTLLTDLARLLDTGHCLSSSVVDEILANRLCVEMAKSSRKVRHLRRVLGIANEYGECIRPLSSARD